MEDDPNVLRFPGAFIAPKVKCNGTTRAGKPCSKWAIKGGNVCELHGGAAPQVQRKAQENQAQVRAQLVDHLFELVKPSIERLKAIIEHGDARPADQLRAIEIVMDRTVGKKVEVSVDDTDVEDLDREIETFMPELVATGTDGPLDELTMGDDDGLGDDDDVR